MLDRKDSKKKIAIFTSELPGYMKSGGVGTGYASLAELLAEDGHSVTIFIVSPPLTNEARLTACQEHYAKLGVGVQLLPASPVPLEVLVPARLAYRCYNFLKSVPFDVVHFPDMYGLGYFCFLAKRLKLAFEDTLFCVLLNGPTQWHYDGNRQFLDTAGDLQIHYLETKSVEWADVLVAPTQYALSWAIEQGWKIPPRVFVENLPSTRVADASFVKKEKSRREIVFFGRLEARKGLDLFCEAISACPPSVLKKTKITFLGTFGHVGQELAVRYLRRATRHWKVPWQVISDLDQKEALDYLRLGNPLAVLASRAETLGYTLIECITSGIPFIASQIPAFEELLAPTDHRRVLFDRTSTSLAQKIAEALDEKAGESVRPAFRTPLFLSDARWKIWHNRVKRPAAGRISRASEKPKVSVVLTHKDRPAFLAESLESLRSQSYRNFEVILADDASEMPESKRLLSELKKEFKSKGWTIFRAAERSGPSRIRNEAVRRAKGKYILFMDDDNIARSHEIEVFVKCALVSGADILTCAMDIFKDTPAKTSARWFGVGDDLATGVLCNVFGDMNCFVKKESFLKIGGLRDVRDLAYEDWEFFTRAVVLGYSLTVVPEPLFWYRDHPRSFSRSADRFESLKMRLGAFGHLMGGRSDIAALAAAFVGAHAALASHRDSSRLEKRGPSLLFARPVLRMGKEKNRELYRAHKRSEFQKIRGLSGVDAVAKNNGLIVTAKTKSPWLKLPPISGKGHTRLRVEIEFLSLAASSLHLKKDDVILRVPYDRGHNKLRFIVPATQGRQEILLRPSIQPGVCVFKKIQVLADP